MENCAFHTSEAANNRISRLPNNQYLSKCLGRITFKTSAQSDAKEKTW